MKLIHYYSKLFTGVLRPRDEAEAGPALQRSPGRGLRAEGVQATGRGVLAPVLAHPAGDRPAPHADPEDDRAAAPLRIG